MKKHPKLTASQITELSIFIGSTSDANESRRAQAVILLDQGNPYSTITLLTCLKRRQIFKYRSVYLQAGIAGLLNKRKSKPKSLLTKQQREDIIEYLSNTLPKDHGYDSEFWSTSILGHLVKEKYGVIYKTKKPFYLLFEEARFSFHKPGKVYEKRDEEKVRIWQAEIEPKLKQAFNDPDIVVICEDEMVLSSQTTFKKYG